MTDRGFWRGRRVLVTGHTGFKGGWLSVWLARRGARVTGFALPPETTPNLFELARVGSSVDGALGDMRDLVAVRTAVRRADPEIVFHLAAQPLVRRSYREPVETFATNVMGTAHLLEAVRAAGAVRAIVVVTTDKVYRNREQRQPYREGDELGGADAYGASKAAAELVVGAWRESFLAAAGVAVATARAGNVIGGGDWSEDRLLPDAVRAWQRGTALEIRRPSATRPWQHVLEPLAAYLRLAERLLTQPDAAAGAWNFGPSAACNLSVREVVELARTHWPAGQVRYAATPDGPHEAHWLALDASRAAERLGLRPRWTVAEAVARTVVWYRAVADGADARALCEVDIDAYEEAA